MRTFVLTVVAALLLTLLIAVVYWLAPITGRKWWVIDWVVNWIYRRVTGDI